MTDALEQISGLLHEAGETHHRFSGSSTEPTTTGPPGTRSGSIDLSELADLLGARPVRSELIYLLVGLDRQYTAEAPSEPWETYYACRFCATSGHQAVDTTAHTRAA